MKPSIYIAAPFFNAEQSLLCDRLENLFAAHGFDYFSPRTTPESLAAKEGMNAELAEEILNRNMSEICMFDVVLAVDHFLLPPGHEVRVVNTYENAYRQISLPDVGVTWECGYARAKEKEIWLLRANVNTPINVMLAQSATLIIPNFETLEQIVQCYAKPDNQI